MKELNDIETLILQKTMAETLSELNYWFCQKDKITKKEFMDLQLRACNTIKKELKK